MFYNRAISEIEENGKTFEENAMIKAKELGKMIVAHCEDNSLLFGLNIMCSMFLYENHNKIDNHFYHYSKGKEVCAIVKVKTYIKAHRASMAEDFQVLKDVVVSKMKEEIGDPNTKVIATGGLSVLVAEESKVIDVLDGLLTLKGLRLIYERNKA